MREGLLRETLDNARERASEIPSEFQVTPSAAWKVDWSAPSSAAAATAVPKDLALLPDASDSKHKDDREGKQAGRVAAEVEQGRDRSETGTRNRGPRWRRRREGKVRGKTSPHNRCGHLIMAAAEAGGWRRRLPKISPAGRWTEVLLAAGWVTTAEIAADFK